MAELSNKTGSTSGAPGKARSISGTAALICSCLAALILAVLLSFSVLDSFSELNIVVFLTMLGLSAVFAFAGIVVGSYSCRKSDSRFALASQLLSVLYIALLIYLVQMVYF